MRFEMKDCGETKLGLTLEIGRGSTENLFKRVPDKVRS